MFSHILIAHDLSLESDIALQRAAQLANQHHARLTLLHVVEGHPDAKALAELQAAAAVSITNTPSIFSTNNHFVDS